MKTTNELTKYFSDALGPDAVMQSPDSPRPYVKVATKGDVVLLANFDLGPACGHKKGKDGKLTHNAAVGVYARFFQKGGDPETFSPPFKVRDFGKGVVRLDKHVFPVCSLFGADIEKSWKKQEVTAQLTDWLKGLIAAAGAQAVPDQILRQVIDLALNSIPQLNEGDYFSLDAMDHKDAETETAEEAQQALDALPEAVKTAIKSDVGEAFAKILANKKKGGSGNGGGLLN